MPLASCVCSGRFTRGGWLEDGIKEVVSGGWNDNDRNFSEYLRLRGYDTVKGTEIDKLEKSGGGGGADKCFKYKSFA